jgi:hypothetical protein
MFASREFLCLSDDVIVITTDIEDCPMVEIPLTELFDFKSFTLVENYIQVLHIYVIELLEDTVWMDVQSFWHLVSAGYDVHHRTDGGEMMAMKKPEFQRLILQTLRHCYDFNQPFAVDLFIKFLVAKTDIQCPPMFPDNDNRSGNSMETSSTRKWQQTVTGKVCRSVIPSSISRPDKQQQPQAKHQLSPVKRSSSNKASMRDCSLRDMKLGCFDIGLLVHHNDHCPVTPIFVPRIDDSGQDAINSDTKIPVAFQSGADDAVTDIDHLDTEGVVRNPPNTMRNGIYVFADVELGKCAVMEAIRKTIPLDVGNYGASDKNGDFNDHGYNSSGNPIGVLSPACEKDTCNHFVEGSIGGTTVTTVTDGNQPSSIPSVPMQLQRVEMLGQPNVIAISMNTSDEVYSFDAVEPRNYVSVQDCTTLSQGTTVIAGETGLLWNCFIDSGYNQIRGTEMEREANPVPGTIIVLHANVVPMRCTTPAFQSVRCFHSYLFGMTTAGLREVVSRTLAKSNYGMNGSITFVEVIMSHVLVVDVHSYFDDTTATGMTTVLTAPQHHRHRTDFVDGTMGLIAVRDADETVCAMPPSPEVNAKFACVALKPSGLSPGFLFDISSGVAAITSPTVHFAFVACFDDWMHRTSIAWDLLHRAQPCSPSLASNSLHNRHGRDFNARNPHPVAIKGSTWLLSNIRMKYRPVDRGRLLLDLVMLAPLLYSAQNFVANHPACSQTLATHFGISLQDAACNSNTRYGSQHERVAQAKAANADNVISDSTLLITMQAPPDDAALSTSTAYDGAACVFHNRAASGLVTRFFDLRVSRCTTLAQECSEDTLADDCFEADSAHAADTMLGSNMSLLVAVVGMGLIGKSAPDQIADQSYRHAESKHAHSVNGGITFFRDSPCSAMFRALQKPLSLTSPVDFGNTKVYHVGGVLSRHLHAIPCKVTPALFQPTCILHQLQQIEMQTTIMLFFHSCIKRGRPMSVVGIVDAPSCVDIIIIQGTRLASSNNNCVPSNTTNDSALPHMTVHGNHCLGMIMGTHKTDSDYIASHDHVNTVHLCGSLEGVGTCNLDCNTSDTTNSLTVDGPHVKCSAAFDDYSTGLLTTGASAAGANGVRPVNTAYALHGMSLFDGISNGGASTLDTLPVFLAGALVFLASSPGAVPEHVTTSALYVVAATHGPLVVTQSCFYFSTLLKYHPFDRGRHILVLSFHVPHVMQSSISEAVTVNNDAFASPPADESTRCCTIHGVLYLTLPSSPEATFTLSWLCTRTFLALLVLCMHFCFLIVSSHRCTQWGSMPAVHFCMSHGFWLFGLVIPLDTGILEGEIRSKASDHCLPPTSKASISSVATGSARPLQTALLPAAEFQQSTLLLSPETNGRKGRANLLLNSLLVIARKAAASTPDNQVATLRSEDALTGSSFVVSCRGREHPRDEANNSTTSTGVVLDTIGVKYVTDTGTNKIAPLLQFASRPFAQPAACSVLSFNNSTGRRTFFQGCHCDNQGIVYNSATTMENYVRDNNHRFLDFATDVNPVDELGNVHKNCDSIRLPLHEQEV